MGFVIGAILGGTVMTFIVGAMGAGPIDGTREAAFRAGMAYERNRHTRGVSVIVENDLGGDEATELGRVRQPFSYRGI